MFAQKVGRTTGRERAVVGERRVGRAPAEEGHGVGGKSHRAYGIVTGQPMRKVAVTVLVLEDERTGLAEEPPNTLT